MLAFYGASSDTRKYVAKGLSTIQHHAQVHGASKARAVATGLMTDYLKCNRQNLRSGSKLSCESYLISAEISSRHVYR